MLDDGADELVARRIFEPAFQVRLVEGRPAFLAASSTSGARSC